MRFSTCAHCVLDSAYVVYQDRNLYQQSDLCRDVHLLYTSIQWGYGIVLEPMDMEAVAMPQLLRTSHVTRLGGCGSYGDTMWRQQEL